MQVCLFAMVKSWLRIVFSTVFVQLTLPTLLGSPYYRRKEMAGSSHQSDVRNHNNMPLGSINISPDHLFGCVHNYYFTNERISVHSGKYCNMYLDTNNKVVSY